MRQFHRLDRLLTSLGYGNRQDVRYLILNGHVTCDGEVVVDYSLRLNPDAIKIDNKPLDPLGLTIVLYKPAGYVCSHDDSGRLIYSLLPPRWQKRIPKMATIGRLDVDTTGVILITDDGQLNHSLASPKNKIAKTYQVRLAKPITDLMVESLEQGVLLNDSPRKTSPATVGIIDETTIYITIHEGRYHQVKRMVAAVGNKVLGLHRIRFGEYDLDGLDAGQYKIVEQNKS